MNDDLIFAIYDSVEEVTVLSKYKRHTAVLFCCLTKHGHAVTLLVFNLTLKGVPWWGRRCNNYDCDEVKVETAGEKTNEHFRRNLAGSIKSSWENLDPVLTPWRHSFLIFVEFLKLVGKSEGKCRMFRSLKALTD